MIIFSTFRSSPAPHLRKIENIIVVNLVNINHRANPCSWESAQQRVMSLPNGCDGPTSTPRYGRWQHLTLIQSYIVLKQMSTPQTSKYIDCLTACTSCLVCFISAVDGCSKKKEKKAMKTELEQPAHNKPQAIYLETFDIYGLLSFL